MIRIAIDGPGGAGKSTIAKMVAEKMNMEYIDTGAMYRAIGWMFAKNKVNTEDSAEVQDVLDRTTIDFDNGKIFLNGEDISGEIRTPEISKAASVCSKLPEVRSKLVALQREIAEGKSVVMDGRDIGTNVLPNAEVKIFLTASPEVRAERRYKELKEKGVDVSYEETLADVIRRDKQDEKQSKAAEDSILLDNSELDFNGTVKRLLEIVEERTGVKHG